VSESGELRIHMRHLRAAGMCNREPRRWFAAHGFSWSDFLDRGIPAADVAATGDALGLIVVEVARQERGTDDDR
jgi:hypothetical protein